MKPLTQLNKLIKCFDKINENIGVNRAPARIRYSGRAGDSGRNIFEKENLITQKNKRNKTKRPRGFGSDLPIRSGQARGRYKKKERVLERERVYILSRFFDDRSVKSRRDKRQS